MLNWIKFQVTWTQVGIRWLHVVWNHIGDCEETSREEDGQNSDFSSSLAAEDLTLEETASVEKTEDSESCDDAAREDV